jgi:hypothetical protein
MSVVSTFGESGDGEESWRCFLIDESVGSGDKGRLSVAVGERL